MGTCRTFSIVRYKIVFALCLADPVMDGVVLNGKATQGGELAYSKC